MTRLATVIALVHLAGCFQSHGADQPELAGTDCYTCHTADYMGTTAPVHRDAPQVFSTGCASCHRTVGWKPALEGSHGEVFVIATGPHTPIACQGCHDLASGQPSALGANTNCIQCHPDDAKQAADHIGVTTVANAPYAYLTGVANFCLACHPSGTADAHPDQLFARTGDHAVACGDCHDRAAGPDTKGGNVTCVSAQCHHTLSQSDTIEDHGTTDYTTARGAGASRNFCHQCHS
jgi:hypothetical protein